MRILSIESSCDETAAAVVEDGRRVLSCVTATQIETHKRFGGVVPEIASRQHTEQISGITRRAAAQAGLSLSQLDAVAVTAYPGLIGALLVGVNFAKGLAYALQKPLVPVHHIKGHIAANYLAYPELTPPFLCLVVSGGHTQLVWVKDYTQFQVLGGTRDDAAGEAFDKVGRMLGLAYPGGVEIDKLCPAGRRDAYQFPKARVEGSPLDFSFSGLKTAALNQIHNARQKGEELCIADFAASFAQAVTDALVSRLEVAATRLEAKKIALAGGVAANSMLREKVQALCAQRRLACYIPPLSLCGDNASMIGSMGYYEYLAGTRADLSLNAVATCKLG